VIVSVINDLVTDQRVHRSCMVFYDLGYEVLLIGRKKKDSKKLEKRLYETKRMKLVFEKGVLFYVEFQIRLFLILLFKKKALLLANDLDTLLPNFFISKWFKQKLIYDSHEIFCEVPELQDTPIKKKVWEKLEGYLIPKLNNCITVNTSIAKWFKGKYNINFVVVRNIGQLPNMSKIKSRQELGLPIDKKILLIQGAGINIQRGAEECVEAMQYMENIVLYIIGGGDVLPFLKQKVEELHLKEKVFFRDKMPATELFHFTSNADIGLTIDKNSNINYRYSLPNKIFDFINAGIPILSSRLPQLEALIEKYDIGDFISSHDPKHIAEKVNSMLNNIKYNDWIKNTQQAKQENNWEIEKQKLIALINQTN